MVMIGTHLKTKPGFCDLAFKVAVATTILAIFCSQWNSFVRLSLKLTLVTYNTRRLRLVMETDTPVI